MNWNKIFLDTFFATMGKLLVSASKHGYDSTHWMEEISKQIGIKISDGFHFKTSWKIERFKVPQIINPFDVSVFHGNVALNEGLNVMTSLICGGAGTAWSNANAQSGTGTGTTAADPADSALTAGVWAAMDGEFPTYGTSQLMTFKSTFADGIASQDWREFSVRNSSGSDKMANRKVQNEGVKPGGQIWILTTTFTGA